MDYRYANIRQMLGFVIGRRVVDVLQQDEDEWNDTSQAYVELLFDDGSRVCFPIGNEPIAVERGVIK